MCVAKRSSNTSRIPAASPAATRLQYSGLKWAGCRRKAALREVPVSTSARMSSSTLAMRGLAWPRPRASKLCSKGTPACSMVASCRVKSAMSPGLIDAPGVGRCRVTCEFCTPWRRSMAMTWFSPRARIWPRTGWPCVLMPCHSKMSSRGGLEARVKAMDQQYECALGIGAAQNFLQ